MITENNEDYGKLRKIMKITDYSDFTELRRIIRIRIWNRQRIASQVPHMLLICSSYVPYIYLPCTSHVPPKFLPSSSHFLKVRKRRRNGGEREEEIRDMEWRRKWGQFCFTGWNICCLARKQNVSPCETENWCLELRTKWCLKNRKRL